jgi:hypothetical protein
VISGQAQIVSRSPWTLVVGDQERLASSSWEGYVYQPRPGDRIEVRAGEGPVWIGGEPRVCRWRGASRPLRVEPGAVVVVVLIIKDSARQWAVWEDI